jgi:hypothetical protein
MQLCKKSTPRTVLINSKFNGVLNVYNGVCKLSERFYDIVAFRVVYFNVSLGAADSDANQGLIIALSSSTLASAVQWTNYHVAISTDTGTNTAQAVPIIGWMARQGSTNGASTITTTAETNPSVQYLARPMSLDQFDWRVSALNQNMPSPMAHAYSIEIAIEFYRKCDCNPVSSGTMWF